MRLVLMVVPRGKGERVLEIARGCGAINLVRFDVSGADELLESLLIHIPNDRVDPLIDQLQDVPEAQFTLIPRGVIALRPPAAEAPDQVVDVTHRSPLEIFLGGLQSVGSWKSLLAYAAGSAVVVWVGLTTNTPFLLTAAMLIAPFAGPAMTLAMGTARGDGEIIRRSFLRYFAALGVSILMAWVLSLVLRLEIASELMVSNSVVSSFALLLPLTAGAIGALHLCQSDRNSLVTAAGTGVLVAASLAPPAGVIGMAAALGEWGMVKSGAFVLLLQLVGINFSGALVFALYGLSPRGVRYERGRAGVRRFSYALTLLALATLCLWQFSSQPELQRSSRAQRIAAEVRQVVNSSGLARAVQVDARFIRAEIPGRPSVLITVYAQTLAQAERSDQELREHLRRRIRQQVLTAGFQVTPWIDLTLMTGD